MQAKERKLRNCNGVWPVFYFYGGFVVFMRGGCGVFGE